MPGAVAGRGGAQAPRLQAPEPSHGGGKTTVPAPENDFPSLSHAVPSGVGCNPAALSAAVELMGMRELKPCLQGAPHPGGQGMGWGSGQSLVAASADTPVQTNPSIQIFQGWLKPAADGGAAGCEGRTWHWSRGSTAQLKP